MDDKKAEIYKSFFECKFCDYITSENSKYNRHILTEKHKRMTFGLHLGGGKAEKVEQDKKYICICGYSYKYRQGLWKHKNKCNINENTTNNILFELLKSNQELQRQMIDVCKNAQITNINYNNKTFNLQFFLNETCKNAMNISEFIENISLQLSDLENMGKLGYVEGVSNIIIKNLNALDVTQRPMHCTDKKRDIMYVKDQDEWQKEEDDKKHIKNVISSVISKNLQLLPDYEYKYPECMNPESKKSDEYNKIIMETMGGGININEEKNKEKIIRKIAQKVVIEKE